jgi:hypothetical protein
MPSEMENEIKNDKLIENLFLDLKSFDLLKTHKIEYQKYQEKRKIKKVAALLLLSLGFVSGGIFLYFVTNKEYSGAIIKSNSKNHIILETNDILLYDSANSVSKSNDLAGTKTKNVELKEVLKPDLNTRKNKSKALKFNSTSSLNTNTEKQCNKKFEDFGINANEQSVTNPVRDIILENKNDNAQIVELKMNGVVQKLPIQDLSDGKYSFEITDQNACKYFKVLKINQIIWEGSNR